MDSLPINAADLAILIVLVLSALLAFSRGFVHEVLGVAAWVGAALVTLRFFAPAQEIARDLIAIELLADIGAGVVVFLIALVIFSIVSRAIGRRVRESSLGFLDRTLGFVFGLARGAVIICLLWLGLSWLMPPEEQPPWVREARALPLVDAGAEMIRALVPAELRLQDTGGTVAGTGAGTPTIDLRTPPLQPAPGTPGEPSEDDAGYGDQPRRELDRLLESIQQGN